MPNLTTEEREVLILAAAGFQAKQIAAIVGQQRDTSDRATSRRLERARKKLDANNITHACVVALMAGIITPEDIENAQR